MTTNTITKHIFQVIGVYISPQFEESNFQWEELKTIIITDNTVVAGDFNKWTDELHNTFPCRLRPHHKGASMLQYMAMNSLVFNLNKEDKGLATPTRWEFDLEEASINGIQLDYNLVARTLACITSRSIVLTSLEDSHVIVVLRIAKPKKMHKHT
ncbi:hypothetical protein DSO57_1015674 [Entomophthora muscae]|uniref:Uncharacterized protein n=1 Tax=Entomophthora muscae TaxID=34485 RepID=A0ACC2UQL5_9FUNG|nr:hypothetical protein DSO57_1015674 [Entomophthora muscae]